ncbi:MAG: SusC/RagA family TonB-linked outer membrane protein, partial [Gemmatimonadetes bacterium]|nr:SusC/RagA family TonB-linked outer membrane protein [Gemmatimonadota bacterium]
MKSRIGLLAALFLLAAGHVSAQTRIVTGRVVDSLSGEPITSGQVQVLGTTVTGTVKDDGTFTVAVPVRDVTISIRSIGYKRREVAAPASSSTVQATLERDYFQLEAIVVTGQATGIERRNLANAVSTVTAEDLVKSPTGSIEQALQGKMAGAQILQTSGAPGGGMRVRLRGVTSILGEAQPLYVVDGVIISDVAISPGTNIVSRASGGLANQGRDAGQQESPINRVADLNPNEIESVEVLKGAAASAIYGSKASNGVIIITTKRGRVGAPQFSVTQRLGIPDQSYHGVGYRILPDSASARNDWGTLADQYWRPNYTPYNHEDYIYNHHPLSYETAASVSGGTETTRYFASGLVKHEGGVITNTFADKQSLRLNLDQAVGSRLSFSANTQVIRNESDRGLTGNDNAGTSYGMTVNKTPNFIDLRQRPDGSWPINPFASSNFLHTASLFKANETVWRVLTSGRAQLDAIATPQHTLRFLANGGADVFTQKDVVISPPELQYEDDDGLLGTYSLTFSQNLNLNVNANAVHTFKPTSGAFSASTSFGVQYETRDLSTSRSVARNLLGGVMAVTAGTQILAAEDHTRVEDFGIFAQEEFLTLGEKLLLTVGGRADQSSNNGDPTKLFFYPKASASYRLTSMPGPIDELKLRAAFGQSGNQPRYGQKFTQLSSGVIGGLGGFQVGTEAGASDLHPERQREIEGGFDATLFGSRANLEVTAYEKKITDLITRRALVPTTGFSFENFNGGTLRTRGLEVSLNLVPVQKATSTWNTRFNFALTRS